MTATRSVVASFALTSVVGCAALSPIPDTRTPADYARQQMTKCDGFADDSIAPLFASSVVDSVEPSYSRTIGGPNGEETHLHGASIHLRPLVGFSPEVLTRNLECHQARVTLGLTAPREGDPYTLADKWLDIDVDSGGDGYVVQVRTEDHDAARRVLDRAQAFAGKR
jgi:hypothetical protein